MNFSGIALPPELQTLHVDLSESDNTTDNTDETKIDSIIAKPKPAAKSSSLYSSQNNDLNDGFSFSHYYTHFQSTMLPLDALICIGVVESIVGSAAMVKGILSTEPFSETIEDTDKPFFIEGVVYTADGTPTGQIVDVWGSVDNPIYTIQLISNSSLQKGDKIMVDRVSVTRAKVDLGKSDSSED